MAELVTREERQPDNRLKATCPKCGRMVALVHGMHTRPGGPPICEGAHVSAARWDAMEEQVDDLRDENAELRRWLGAAVEHLIITGRFIETFRALSRGEPVSDEVKRMYLGDEE